MAPSFLAWAAWISGLNVPGMRSSGNASPTLGDEASSPNGSPESPATQTFAGWDESQTAVTLSRRDFKDSKTLISSQEEAPAKTSPSPADVRASSKGKGRRFSSTTSESSSLFAPPGSCLRMFPDSFPLTVDEISPSFSRRWPSSGMAFAGECWTLDTSEFPNDAVECSLSDILEPDPPSRFSLSSRAAAGILRRAKKRGRTLPPRLETALESVAGASTQSQRGGGISLSGMGNGGPDDNDAQAGRIIADTVRSHPRPGSNSSGSIIAFHATQDPISETGGGTPAMSSESSGPLAVVMRQREGKPGGGKGPLMAEDESLTLAKSNDQTLFIDAWAVRGSGSPNQNCVKDDGLSDALDTTAPGAVAYTHALTSEGFDASEDGTGRGTPLVPDEMQVRRLTTVECSRLQGFPDDWFGEPNALPDGPRYAGLGDAVTVNVAQWIGRRIGSTVTTGIESEEGT